MISTDLRFGAPVIWMVTLQIVIVRNKPVYRIAEQGDKATVALMRRVQLGVIPRMRRYTFQFARHQLGQKDVTQLVLAPDPIQPFSLWVKRLLQGSAIAQPYRCLRVEITQTQR